MFTYQLSKEMIIENCNLYEIINKLSDNKKQFLSRFFLHLETIIDNGTANESDIISTFSELLIEIHPKDSTNDSVETLKCVNVFNQIFTNWRDYFPPNLNNNNLSINNNNNNNNNNSPSINNRNNNHDNSSNMNSTDTDDEHSNMSKVPVTKVYSIQERSLKISFPKGDYEDNFLDKNSLSKLLTRFGEISEMGWKEKFCILSYKNMKSVLDFLDEWESTLPEGYKVKPMGIVPTREEFNEDQKKIEKQLNQEKQRRSILPTYSEHIRRTQNIVRAGSPIPNEGDNSINSSSEPQLSTTLSTNTNKNTIPIPPPIIINNNNNNNTITPSTPGGVLSPKKETKKLEMEIYRQMHHESSPAPSDNGMDDDDTFDGHETYDGKHHLSAHAGALLSRISTADESDDIIINNTQQSPTTNSPGSPFQILNERSKQQHLQQNQNQNQNQQHLQNKLLQLRNSQRDLSTNLMSLSNDVSVIQPNKSLNNTVYVQDFLSVDSLSDAGQDDSNNQNDVLDITQSNNQNKNISLKQQKEQQQQQQKEKEKESIEHKNDDEGFGNEILDSKPKIITKKQTSVKQIGVKNQILNNLNNLNNLEDNDNDNNSNNNKNSDKSQLPVESVSKWPVAIKSEKLYSPLSSPRDQNISNNENSNNNNEDKINKSFNKSNNNSNDNNNNNNNDWNLDHSGSYSSIDVYNKNNTIKKDLVKNQSNYEENANDWKNNNKSRNSSQSIQLQKNSLENQKSIIDQNNYDNDNDNNNGDDNNYNDDLSVSSLQINAYDPNNHLENSNNSNTSKISRNSKSKINDNDNEVQLLQSLKIDQKSSYNNTNKSDINNIDIHSDLSSDNGRNEDNHGISNKTSQISYNPHALERDPSIRSQISSSSYNSPDHYNLTSKSNNNRSSVLTQQNYSNHDKFNNQKEYSELNQLGEAQKSKIIQIITPKYLEEEYINEIPITLDSSVPYIDRNQDYKNNQNLYQQNQSQILPQQSRLNPQLTNVNVDMEHLMHRIRILEAETRAKREQHRDDEERYKLSESSWSAEIITLKVHIKDLEDKLHEERNRNRKLLSELATRDAEVASLTASLESMKLIINNAKETADREALSTVLAQQRLIKMLERQRNAESEKSKLLESEVIELRSAYQQIVNEMIDRGIPTYAIKSMNENILNNTLTVQSSKNKIQYENNNNKNESDEDNINNRDNTDNGDNGEEYNENDNDNDNQYNNNEQNIKEEDELREKQNYNSKTGVNYIDRSFNEDENNYLESSNNNNNNNNNHNNHFTPPNVNKQFKQGEENIKPKFGVDLDEVSAIRATAQAQIEKYLEKRSEKNKSQIRNKILIKPQESSTNSNQNNQNNNSNIPQVKNTKNSTSKIPNKGSNESNGPSINQDNIQDNKKLTSSRLSLNERNANQEILENDRKESISSRERRKFHESLMAQQELSNQLVTNLTQSRKDINNLPQTMKWNQMKSSTNRLNDFYNPDKDPRFNHIVEPPKLPIGHPLSSPSSSLSMKSQSNLLYPTNTLQKPSNYLSMNNNYNNSTNLNSNQNLISRNIPQNINNNNYNSSLFNTNRNPQFNSASNFSQIYRS